MADQEMIQEKIGEALGLEKAAQKAVKDLDSRGLLKPEQMKKLSKMKEELEDAGDKVKAGAKAVANKIADPDKDLDSEYHKEKIEEKMD